MKTLLFLFSAIAAYGQVKTSGGLIPPSYTVATLPAAPPTGTVVIVTDSATAGSCTSGSGSATALCRYADAAWASIGDGGSGSSYTAGNGLELVSTTFNYRGRLDNARTSATVLTFGSDCSSTYPCNVGAAGSTMYPITASFTVTISTGTGNLYVYKSSAGTTTVAKTTGDSMDPACSAGCTVGSAITAFPVDSTPLYLCTATSSATWDSPACVDYRPAISRPGKNIICSTNMTCDETATGVTLSSSGGSSSFVSGILSRQGPNSNVTLTGGATYDTVFTYTLPANTLGANGCLRVTLGARNSGTVTYRIGWGTATYDIGGFGAETYGARAEFVVCNTGATNAQSILFPHVAGLWYAFVSTSGPGFYPLTTATQDTTSTVLITLKANGTAADTVTPVWFLVNQL